MEKGYSHPLVEGIKFLYKADFAGSTYYILLNDGLGGEIYLGRDYRIASDVASRILVDNLGIDILPSDIPWQWDGMSL